MNIKSIIVEDSRLARIELQEMLKHFDTVEVVAEAQDASIAKKIIEDIKPDLIFLDIQMPGKNGFELLGELKEVPAIIFTTAYDQYAVQSFDYNTVDYLMKPISEERLAIAVKRAEERIQGVKEIGSSMLTEESSVFIKDGEKCWFVKLADVFMLESNGNYTHVYFENNKPMLLRSLSHFEEVLDKNIFFRINRSLIINLKYIDSVVSWFSGRLKLKLKTGHEVEVSRRQTDRLKGMFSF